MLKNPNVKVYMRSRKRDLLKDGYFWELTTDAKEKEKMLKKSQG